MEVICAAHRCCKGTCGRGWSSGASLVDKAALLCLVQFYFVKHFAGQQLLQVLPDEHGEILGRTAGQEIRQGEKQEVRIA